MNRRTLYGSAYLLVSTGLLTAGFTSYAAAPDLTGQATCVQQAEAACQPGELPRQISREITQEISQEVCTEADVRSAKLLTQAMETVEEKSSQAVKEAETLGIKKEQERRAALEAAHQQELELLAHIRQHFSPQEIELRVDANGAFTPLDAPRKLEQLSRFGLHSIEQPIRAGQWEEMRKLCQDTPIPIALDEELIGVNRPEEKARLLDTVRPQYIILKPSLHGGLKGAEEWIRLAGERGIGSWVTSALESNVGLNSIAQWCATLNPQMPQGLGTGLLFTDNVDYPLHIEGDCLWCQGDNTEPELWSYLKGDGGTDD